MSYTWQNDRYRIEDIERQLYADGLSKEQVEHILEMIEKNIIQECAWAAMGEDL